MPQIKVDITQAGDDWIEKLMAYTGASRDVVVKVMLRVATEHRNDVARKAQEKAS